MAFLWFINGGDPNYLLTGMILQVILGPWKTRVPRFFMQVMIPQGRRSESCLEFFGDERVKVVDVAVLNQK